jgi:hypothetical protein
MDDDDIKRSSYLLAEAMIHYLILDYRLKKITKKEVVEFYKILFEN